MSKRWESCTVQVSGVKLKGENLLECSRVSVYDLSHLLFPYVKVVDVSRLVLVVLMF